MNEQGPWVIRVVATGHGNTHCFMREGGPQYVANPRETFSSEWYGRIGPATIVYKRKGNAERWLRERPGVHGVVEIDPREIIKRGHV